MTNPKYLINISYQPITSTTQSLVYNATLGTYSVPNYVGDYFIASMPEMKLSATGASYGEAFNKLVNLAVSSSNPDPGTPPYNSIKTW